MPRFPYRLALILSGPENRDLGQYPIEPDWLPVRESVQFELLRRDGMNVTPIGEEDFSLTPIFSAESGEPWLEGVSAIAESNGRQLSLEIPNAAFVRPASRLLSARMVAENKVEAGDLITYRTVAYPITDESSPRQASPLTEVAILPPIHEIASLEANFPGAIRVETDAGDDAAEPFPVLVSHDLIEEIKAASEAANTLETGGLLLGRLHRFLDADGHRLAVEVTARIPAQYTEATSTSLRFTDETWAAANHALRLRKLAGDSHATLIVGWVHSHPAKMWCPESCPMENRLACPKQSPFFSSDDLSLHREVFPKAYHLALLVNVADASRIRECWSQGTAHGTALACLPLPLCDQVSHPHRITRGYRRGVGAGSRKEKEREGSRHQHPSRRDPRGLPQEALQNTRRAERSRFPLARRSPNRNLEHNL